MHPGKEYHHREESRSTLPGPIPLRDSNYNRGQYFGNYDNTGPVSYLYLAPLSERAMFFLPEKECYLPLRFPSDITPVLVPGHFLTPLEKALLG